MRNLLLILISASLIPTTSWATSLDDCKKTVKSAETVIQKQDELIHVMKDRNDDLFKEKTALETEIEDANSRTQTAQEHEILWGIIGVAAGVLATVWVTSRTR